MKAISKASVISSVTDPHKLRIINRAERFYTLDIESPELIDALIMHYHSRSRCLTPTTHMGFVKKTWTIGRVVNRMIDEGITFEHLASGKESAIPAKELFWYERFLPLIEQFSYQKMDPLLLFNPNNQEQKDCPDGAFKLIDGMHRTLVLSYLLKKKQIEFQPVKAILLTPRVYKY